MCSDVEDWSVPGSGSEEEAEGGGEEAHLDFGGIKIPHQRLLELMQTVQEKRTVELDSLNDTYLKKRHKKKKKKRKKRVGGADASETASEIRSTTCTSTTPTESRDVRRSKADLMFGNPELDDYDTPAASKPLLPTRKKAPPLTHKRVGQLASLDKITADMKKRQHQWHLHEQSEQLKGASVQQPSTTGAAPADWGVGDRGEFTQPNSTGKREEGEEGERMEVDGEGLAMLGEDSDQDSDSDSDMKMSLMSQINKVEQILDFEVS